MAPEAESIHEDGAVPMVKSTITRFLDLPPSCVEFSPLNPRLFVVGTYLLEPGIGKPQPGDLETTENPTPGTLRRGSLILGLVGEQSTDPPCANQRLQGLIPPMSNSDSIEPSGSTTLLSVSLWEAYPTPYAVLDLHFSPDEPTTLAVATSIGKVSFFRLDLMDGGHLAEIGSIQVSDPGILVTSLAWKPSSSTRPMIAVSLSNGKIAIFTLDSPDTTLRTVEAHSLEVWTVAWSVTPGTEGIAVLYSGGDDSALCRHSEHLPPQDVQVDEDGRIGDVYEPLSRDAKTHGAGVTAILPIPVTGSNGQKLLLTGSYDEYMRILEPAVTGRRSKILAEKRLGGGVWRLKLLRKVDYTQAGKLRLSLLASCMHAGARVLEISRSAEGTWTIVVLAKFEEHESMNYASDASTQINRDLESLIFISTSFYDKKLCVWNIKHPD